MMQTILNKIPKFLKSKWVLGIIVLVLLIIGGYFLFHKNPTYQFVTVERGSITESVSLTGNTMPEQSVSLTFGSSGIVFHIYSDLGKQVYKEQVLAELNTNDLVAQLHNAQAALIIAKQQASSSKDNLANVIAEQNTLVENVYHTLLSNGLAAVPSSKNYTMTPPIITGVYDGLEGKYEIYIDKKNVTDTDLQLRTYNLEKTNNVKIEDSEPTQLGTRGLFISFPDTLSTYYDTIWYVTIPNIKSTSYLSNYNAYQGALETRNKAIATAQASVGTNNSSTVSDAEIAQAQANVDSIIAKIQNAKIIAPISGVITQFDAKVGELASQSASLVSIMSDTGYEVDAGVSETDIGKISIGNKVSMTLDAFPNETFTGSVFYIAPAETNVQGVVSFQVKISFDNPDPRLKSGLTANLDIQTRQKDNVLILPQYAILQNDAGTFVQTLENNVTKQNPVTLGLQDQKGNVEIISGVTEGEQVLNIGLKAQ
jgi:HlyD family secretion protein